MPNRRSGIGALTALILVLAVTGCSSTADSLDQAVSSTSSAVASSQLGLKLFADERATNALTDTVLLDAATEVDKAQTSVQQLSVSTGDAAEAKATTLSAIRAAVDAIDHAEQALDDGSPQAIAAARAELDRAADELDAAR